MRSQDNVESTAARERGLVEGDEQFTGGPLDRFEHEIDRVNALVAEAIRRLSRHCPDHETGGTALDVLQRIMPHVEEALAALTQIERLRGLTPEELSRRRAFKMLLEGAKRG